ncbi:MULTISPECIES: hypothetical protein [Rhizobium/Agrobacterium group]|uniref:Type II toxin-antitoxin system ParD family antitoxin n=2 Tax=Neorhizobium TaxID=1525371 RepID=A0ABV0LZ65_9HYPH|nr:MULTISPECIES: hypothetical protein [Rhizobium/Agrobacterium group]KGD87739.1 hypothetical protein JL39_26270 [Rhizobium sp. YS-1r]MCC2612193.1 type II toxin-antitoxin system ParD family antitoxin [Neorhizobium petrolearium]WGI67343.1 type II toxin-antitoxin system ParD family antitoxin [Neorhizobium petrolearium]
MAEAVKVTVTLEPDIEDFVRDQTERGSFASSSDYIETVLRERFERAREQLDAELQKGIDDIEAGRFMSIEEAFDSVYEELGLKRLAR